MSTSETAPLNDLSEREIEILRLVATGASNKGIAQRLYISPNTVKVHLRNIFAKIGVASRTGAALYAVRAGWVPVPGEAPAGGEGNHGADGNAPATGEARPASPPTPAAFIRERVRQHPWRTRLWITALATLFVSLGVLVNGFRPKPPQPTPPPATALPRWQAKADLPTARSGLAVTTYENQVYAIGGETAQGVTGAVERYDVTTDRWATLTPKPVPVADVGAVVIGGQIYFPGGRTASGDLTDVLESYDPRRDQWQQHAPLPTAVSAYALTTFEGRLYLFGGWDGQRYLASVYEYDPSQDKWIERTPMPTARGYMGATVAGGIIYVIGGYEGTQALSVNEGYAPEREGSGDGPWRVYRPLPAVRFGMGVTSIADIVLVIGGEGETPAQPSLEYFPQRDEWQAIETSVDQPGSRLGLAVVGTNLHTLGGEHEARPTSAHWVYQAIYTTVLPQVTAP